MSDSGWDEAAVSPVLKSTALVKARERAQETRTLEALFEPASGSDIKASDDGTFRHLRIAVYRDHAERTERSRR